MSMNYQEALAEWVVRREMRPALAISDVFVDSMNEGGWCGNDTCWFEGEVTVSFTITHEDDGFEDESRETQTYHISPGDFVAEIAAISQEGTS